MLALKVCVVVKPSVSEIVDALVMDMASLRAGQLAAWATRSERPVAGQHLLLRGFLDLLARCEIDQNTVDSMIRMDFVRLRAMKATFQLRSMLWAKEEDLQFAAKWMGTGQTASKLRWNALRTQPNRCDDILARHGKYWLEQSRLPYIKRTAWDRPAAPSGWSLYPNAGGEFLLLTSLSDSGHERIFCSLDHSRAKLRLMAVVFAIARHRLDHAGALPRTLGHLVPAYLESVPQDPFTGGPVSYDPALGRIWSKSDDGLTDPTPAVHTTALSKLIPPGLESLFQRPGPADLAIDIRKFFGE